MAKSPSQNGDSDPSTCAAATSDASRVTDEASSAIDEPATVVERNASDESVPMEMEDIANVKTEPPDNAGDLLLDDELRLQIEKSIQMVVNEYSLDDDDLMDGTFDGVEEALGVSSEANTSRSEEILGNGVNDTRSTAEPSVVNVRGVSSSSCVKGADEMSPRIPNDITVIPLSRGTSSIKSEPREGTDVDGRTKKLPGLAENCSSSMNPYLASIATGKHSSLTILPVTGAAPLKNSTNVVTTKGNGVVSKGCNNSVEFSLTPDVTIKTVLANGSTAKYNNLSSCQNSIAMYPPKQSSSIEQYAGATQCSVRGGNNNVTLTPFGYENKPIGEPLPASTACTFNANNMPSCLYSKPIYPMSPSCAPLTPCSFPSTRSSKSCSAPYSAAPTLQTPSQSQALVPHYNNPNSSAFCNYNTYAQSASPKHPKPPVNALNPCRMSSSPVPAYMRSKEPSYSAPLLCNIISESFAGMMPQELPSFKPTPPWSLGCSTPSFRSPTSPASMNFTLPSPAALAPSSNSPATFSSYANQMIPVNHNQVKPQNSYGNSFRSNFTPLTPSSPFQRAQCCFSSQVQCFNAGCTGSSQQQFSIVQHSTRLSNLKSNSMDSVSSLLQYHTYFKKY